MSNSTFDNGQTFSSSAQTPDSMALIFQALAAQILGLDPVGNPSAAFSAVRVAWPQAGQPGYGINDDVCVVACTTVVDPVSQINDQFLGPSNPVSVTQNLGYTQVWNVHFEVYGPNSFSHAQLIGAALSLDWVHDSLAASGIYVVANWSRPVYVPYLQNAQWWKRTDLDMQFNELVLESTSISTAASATITLIKENGISDEITISS